MIIWLLKCSVEISIRDAGRENRTLTLFLERDFKSRASTYSAIPARDEVILSKKEEKYKVTTGLEPVIAVLQTAALTSLATSP